MSSATLKDQLSAALPEGLQCKIRYIRTASKTCDPLFSAPLGKKPEETRLASHLLTASVIPQQTSNSQDVLVLALEVLVFTTRRLTTIFVSKADSTGYLPQHRPSAIKSICTTYLKWLSETLQQKNPSRKIVISLFARAQSQYLFPGSAENSGKHVLDDRQLIKWWARVLHPIITQAETKQSGDEAPKYQGYITVPGYDKTELRSFFPRESLASGEQHWIAGNPLEELAETRLVSIAAPTRCLLPRFPDDPKSRFMQDLDEEVGLSEETSSQASPSKRKDGRWSSIRDLSRFWEAMEFRQECSSGRSVGFLWVVIAPTESASQDSNIENGESQDSFASAQSAASISKTNAKGHEKARRRTKKPLSGPIIPRKPRLKGGSSNLSTTSGTEDAPDGNDNDGLLLNQIGYDQAMQTLLHLDFANREVAAHSTSKWVTEVSSIRGLRSDWAMSVAGTLRPEQAPVTSGGATVNNVGGMLIKRKRKAEDEGTSNGANDKSQAASTGAPAVNVLGAGMIRKKPKAA